MLRKITPVVFIALILASKGVYAVDTSIAPNIKGLLDTNSMQEEIQRKDEQNLASILKDVEDLDVSSIGDISRFNSSMSNNAYSRSYVFSAKSEDKETYNLGLFNAEKDIVYDLNTGFSMYVYSNYFSNNAKVSEFNYNYSQYKLECEVSDAQLICEDTDSYYLKLDIYVTDNDKSSVVERTFIVKVSKDYTGDKIVKPKLYTLYELAENNYTVSITTVYPTDYNWCRAVPTTNGFNIPNNKNELTSLCFSDEPVEYADGRGEGKQSSYRMSKSMV